MGKDRKRYHLSIFCQAFFDKHQPLTIFTMARQDTAQATQEMPEAQIPRQETRETTMERTELSIGDVIQNKRLDGSPVEDRYLGGIHVGDQTLEATMRTSGDTPRIRTDHLPRGQSRLPYAIRLQLYGEATTSAAQSSVKAEGLTGDVAQSILEEIKDDESLILVEAAGTSDPEQAMIKAVTAEVRAITIGEVIERPTLQQLTEQLREIRDQLGAHLDDKTSKGQKKFQHLSEQERAIQQAIFDRRTKLEPEMDDEGLTLLADEVDGFVEPIPDVLYQDGEQAIKNQLQTVFEQLTDARNNNDSEAMIRLTDEMSRHEAALALLQQTPEMLEEILGDADILEVLTTPPPVPQETAADRLLADMKKEERQLEVMENSPFTLKQQVKNAKGETVEVAHIFPPDEDRIVRILVRGGKEQLAIIEDTELAKLNGMEITDLADTDLEFADEDIEIAESVDETPWELQESEEEQQERESSEQRFNEVLVALKTAGISVETEGLPASFDEVQQLNTKDREAMMDKVRDLHYTYLGRARQATEAGISRVSGKREGREIPETSIEELDESDILEIDTEPTPVSDEMKEKYPDLIQNKILTSAEDLRTWENTYDDLLQAMRDAGKNPLELEGLPANFAQVLNTKDERGFFGKLFRRPSKRVQLFKKIQELQLQYQVPKSTDMSSRNERQKVRAQAQARTNVRVGSGTITGGRT